MKHDVLWVLEIRAKLFMAVHRWPTWLSLLRS